VNVTRKKKGYTMADEATDVKDAEITLDDFNADEQEPAKAEPSPAKKAEKLEEKPEAKETKEEVKPEATKPKAKAEPEESKETEGEVEKPAVETDKPTKGDERKTQLNTEIRDLVSQRNALREEVTKANSEVYQPATEAELEADGMTELEAKVEAMRQAAAMDKYNNEVADTQLTLESESQRVLQDFPIFNQDSDSYDKELADEAAELLQANLVIDPNSGQVIGSNVSPYQLYKTLARASGISETKGQIKGQEDAEKMLANTDTNSGVAPPAKPKDELMDLWTSDD